MTPDSTFTLAAREYFDIHFGHLNQGIADIKSTVAANQLKTDAELRELWLRVDAIEKECDERRGRDKSVEDTLNWIKWLLAPVIGAVLTLVVKMLLG